MTGGEEPLPVTYPTSFFQEIFWWGERVAPTSSSMPWTGRFRGQLSVTTLRAALSQVMARHASLRATYELTSHGMLVQRVHDALPVPLSETDLSGKMDESFASELAEMMSKELRKPVDLATTAPFRMKVITRSHDEVFLQLVLSHVAFDGRAITNFLSELSECYNAIVQRRKPRLPDINVSGPELAATEHEALQAASMDAHRRHWVQFFAGTPLVLRTPLFPGRGAPGGADHKASIVNLDLLPMSTLRSFASEHRCSPFQVALACFQLLLHRYSERQELAVSSMFEAREDARHEAVIASLARDMWLGSRLQDDDTFLSFLGRTRLLFFEWMTHRELPGQELGAAPYASRAYLKSQTRWSFQGLPADLSVRALTLDGLSELPALPAHTLVNTWHDERPAPDDVRIYPDTSADVRVFFHVDHVQLRVAGRGAEGGLHELASTYRNLLLRCIADPGRPVAELTADIDPIPPPPETIDLLGTPVPIAPLVTALRQLPTVRDAVLAVAHEGALQWLEAFLVVAGPPPDLETVQQHVLAALPSFPVPRHVFVVRELPGSDQAPVEPIAVPLPARALDESRSLSVLRAVWRELTGCDIRYPREPIAPFARRDLLFCLLFARRARAAGLSVTVDELFGEPSLAAVSARIDRDRAPV